MRLYTAEPNLAGVRSAVEDAVADLDRRRSVDYFGATLWHHSARSTEYFSRWIELKAGRCKLDPSLKAQAPCFQPLNLILCCYIAFNLNLTFGALRSYIKETGAESGTPAEAAKNPKP